jgi:NOL1/NOP2/fmu family ribosome biogenesis protein
MTRMTTIDRVTVALGLIEDGPTTTSAIEVATDEGRRWLRGEGACPDGTHPVPSLTRS